MTFHCRERLGDMKSVAIKGGGMARQNCRVSALGEVEEEQADRSWNMESSTEDEGRGHLGKDIRSI